MKLSTYIFLIFLILLPSFWAFAQPPPPPPNGGGGPGTVNDLPLNVLIYPFLFIGAYLGVRFFKKSENN